MKRALLILAAFLVVASTAAPATQAQTYHSGDLQELRAFLRQTSADSVHINAERLNLSLADTATWTTSTEWVAKLDGVDWNDSTPKRIISINWSWAGVAGVINANKWTELEGLFVNESMITSINASGCNKLGALYCMGAPLLAELNLDGCTTLETLECFMTRLTELDLSSCVNLSFIDCGHNPYLTKLDVSGCTEAEELFLGCLANKLSNLDLSKNVNLVRLDCSMNPLKTLDLSNNINLNELMCIENQLTVLDVRKNTHLNTLECGGNQLTVLDLSKNPYLTTLSVQDNLLSALDISMDTGLIYFYCSGNQLTSLDLSNNPNLQTLVCDRNELTTLDLSNNLLLQRVDCQSNRLTALDLAGKPITWYFNGSGQRVSMKLYNNGSGIYTRPIMLNSPKFADSSTISYADTLLQSSSTAIAGTDFTVETGHDSSYQLSGYMQFTYSEDAPEAPSVTTGTLPDGTVGVAYVQTLAATGDMPAVWSLTAGNLPEGLSLSSSGVISGVPAEEGTSTFTVKAENLFGEDSKELSITMVKSTSIEDLLAKAISIYPNPVKDELTIKSSGLQIESIDILDITGRNVKQIKGSTRINVSALPNGIYFVRIKTAQGKLVRKIIKR